MRIAVLSSFASRPLAYHTGLPAGTRRLRPARDEIAMTLPTTPGTPARPSPSGEQWVIGHGSQRAVVTEVGGTLRSYAAAGRAVIDGFGADDWCHDGRGQVLAPWPNRLADGQYTFGGVSAQAPLDEPAHHNAIHGLVRWLPWRRVSQAQNRVTVACTLHPTPGYPWMLELEVDYHLGRDGLTVTAAAANPGTAPVPFGVGFHPYLHVPGGDADTARLTVPADRRLATDGRGLPVAEHSVAGTELDFFTGRPLTGIRLDTCFTGLRRGADGRSEVRLGDAAGEAGEVVLWADERFPYVMVFTGDTLGPDRARRSVAVEPMTCPPDALRSGKDLVVLAPSARWSGAWGIRP
jgi:galactose mutarotase-like enzyme